MWPNQMFQSALQLLDQMVNLSTLDHCRQPVDSVDQRLVSLGISFSKATNSFIRVLNLQAGI